MSGPKTDGLEALDDVTEEAAAKNSAATKVVELASGYKLVRDKAGDAYGVAPGTFEALPLRGAKFRSQMAFAYFKAEGRAIGSAALGDGVNTLAAKAQFEGELVTVYTRAAEVGDSVIIDLGPDQGDVIVIDKDGYKLSPTSPVLFTRPGPMQRLPPPAAPDPASTLLDEIGPFINVGGIDDEMLVAVWLISTVFDISYAVLSILGRQGSAKTTTTQNVRSIIDPHGMPIRGAPRTEEDLLIGARNGLIIALDNVSFVNTDTSDALCRLATGGGISKRTLYSDGEETIISVRRPCILNGISDGFGKADLIDRSVVLDLPILKPQSLKSEKAMRDHFQQRHPQILGALCAAVSQVLAHRPQVRENPPPLTRLTDFTIIGEAFLQSIGRPRGEFYELLQRNRAQSSQVLLDMSHIAPHVMEIADPEFTGTAGEWLDRVNTLFDGRDGKPGSFKSPGFNRQRPKGWPDSPKRFSETLSLLEPSLLHGGYEVTRTRTGGSNSKKLIRVRRLLPKPSFEAPPFPLPAALAGGGANGVSTGSVVTPDDPAAVDKGPPN